MIVQFANSPHSLADTSKHLPFFVSTGEVVAPTVSGAFPFGGRITNGTATPPGSLRYFQGPHTGYDKLVWRNSTGGGVYDYWLLDAGAGPTALNTILTAIAGDEASIILNADGTLGS